MRAKRVKQGGPLVIGRTRYLLEKPQDMFDDRAYPPGETVQSFHWGAGREGEWRIVLAPDHYSFAELLFRRPYDFTSNRGRFAVKFKLSPASRAETLAITLVDGRKDAGLVELPLSPYRVTRRGNWDYFLVPLEAFAEEGLYVLADRGGVGEGFAWVHVAGLRITSMESKHRGVEILLRHLRFARIRPRDAE